MQKGRKKIIVIGKKLRIEPVHMGSILLGNVGTSVIEFFV